MTLSSGYHHSSNPAEQAVKTVKSLMKRCLQANTSWHIALIEYLSTPLGANIPSPSELMGRQFRGILPFFQDRSASESIKEQVLLMKEAEKQRFDKMAHDLPVIPVGATVSYINKDQKTWSIGKVESHTLRSYVVLTEEGRLISENRVHIRHTNVPFQASHLSQIFHTHQSCQLTNHPKIPNCQNLSILVQPPYLLNQHKVPQCQCLHHQELNLEPDLVD